MGGGTKLRGKGRRVEVPAGRCGRERGKKGASGLQGERNIRWSPKKQVEGGKLYP